MKKNLTFIALVATAIFCSCGSSETKETTETAQVQEQQEKPKVKIEKVVA